MTQNLLDQPTDKVSFDPNKDYFAELTGPGGKFHDPDPEVAKQKVAFGKITSDIHISTLEPRLDELREDYTKARNENITGAKLQELLTKLETAQLASRDNTQNSNEVNQNKPEQIDPTQFKSLITEEVSRMRDVEREEANYSQVQGKLLGKYGANYVNVLKDQQKALGLSDEEVNSMARKNPNLFSKTFDLDAPTEKNLFQAPLQNQRINNSYTPGANQKRTLSYYKELRKKDPSAYYNPKIAVQMDKDAIALGKEFFDA